MRAFLGALGFVKNLVIATDVIPDLPASPKPWQRRDPGSRGTIKRLSTLSLDPETSSG